MKTDNWLTDNSNYDQCPMCSKLLKRGSGTCYACGFTLNPSPVSPLSAAPASSAVWIDPTMHGCQYIMPHQTPARQHIVQSTAQPRKQPNPTTPKPSPIWQYESTDYEAAGSLPALSMFVPESPTQPQPPVRARTTRRLPEIDAINTVPPDSRNQSGHIVHTAPTVHNPHNAPTAPISLRLDEGSYPSLAMIPAPAQHIDEIDTNPQMSKQHSTRALVPAHTTALRVSSGSSWTAGGASVSPYAQLLVNPSKRRKRHISLNPLEPVRWWLLRPGRIEFMLWLGGTLLLIGVTCILLLVSAFSFQWGIPGVPAPLSASNTSNNGGGNQEHIGITSSPGLWLGRVDKGPVVPGQSIQLRGRGFSRSSQVTFSFDGSQPLYDQDGKPGSTRTDSQGTFDVTLWLGTGNAWTPGSHIIIARDVATRHVAVLNIVLVASTNGATAKSSPVSSATVSTSTPGATPTSAPTTPVPQGSPVNKTPVPTSPTPVVSPSPTQAPPTTTPTVTPTVKTTPSVTPTVKSTPSPTPTGGTHSPTASPSTGNSNLSNDLNASGDPPFGARLTTLSPLVWLMVACYSLSMMLLGLAGLLYKLRR